MNTIGDLQNEMDCLYHYIEIEYNHDYEKVTMTHCYTNTFI